MSCCSEFAKQAGELLAPVAGGLYPPSFRPKSQFQQDNKSGSWNINGCCGGGCYVVINMKFCPYCGAKL
jgi:hypothetical protein